MNKDIEDCALVICAALDGLRCKQACGGCIKEAQASARFWLTREVSPDMMFAGRTFEEHVNQAEIFDAMRRAQLAELGLAPQTEKEKR